MSINAEIAKSGENHQPLKKQHLKHTDLINTPLIKRQRIRMGLYVVSLPMDFLYFILQVHTKTLNEIYSSYIEKDVIGYLNVKEPIKYSKLITVLADQIGSGTNFSSISNLLGIHIRTLEGYVYALEQTFVIRRVHPFFTNKQKEITKMPKIYFMDTGLRNFAVRNFEEFSLRKDRGNLLENYVFTALMRNEHLTANYWRTKDKNEVDFIVKDFYGNVIPIEVKATEMKKPTIFKNFRIFLEKYNIKKGYIVNLSMEREMQFNERLAEFVLPYHIEFTVK